MEKTLLILAAMILFLGGCKKFDEIEASKVEMNDVTIERGWDYIKISGEYDYPVDLEAMTLYLSEKEDMSGAKTYGCNVEGKTFSVEIKDLKEGTRYYYQYEYDNGYGKEKSKKENVATYAMPVVVTKDVTNITAISATLNGSVTSSDTENKITAKGFCWGTEPELTIEGTHTNDGSDTGTYSYNLTNLTENTTYYVRAYATTKLGTAYGEEKSFKTAEVTLPTVTTNDVTNITTNSASCGGNVTDDGNGTVTARGICWSEVQNPTINNIYSEETNNGTGTGSFTSQLTNLKENTTYYVRAYATNEKGTNYGEEKSFTTAELKLPTVTTKDVTNITTNSAICGGNVTDDGNGTVTARGICWSETHNPTINNIYSEETNNGTGTGSFTSQLTNLKENTTYYVRAYATNEKGTNYGEEKSFTTLSSSGTINGYKWIDLGLPSGLKWATCNVGSNNPEDYGDYFAWGETTTTSEYTLENSLTYGLSISELQSQGIIDGDYNLTPSHDAATANWGGTWRLPTKAEMEELKNNCTWEWTVQGGKNGYKVTGPNGNNIFLPAAGCRNGSSLYYAGEYGDYWSSTPYDSYSYYAWYLYFYSGVQYMNDYYRYRGLSVRPVTE